MSIFDKSFRHSPLLKELLEVQEKLGPKFQLELEVNGEFVPLSKLVVYETSGLCLVFPGEPRYGQLGQVFRTDVFTGKVRIVDHPDYVRSLPVSAYDDDDDDENSEWRRV